MFSYRSDLVKDSRLATEFLANHAVKHTFYESSPSTGRRRVRRDATWNPTRELGRGGFGDVWLQKGPWGALRAVKQIRKDIGGKHVHYFREIEAAMKFSHRNYVQCFVQCLGWYENSTEVFLVMEYLAHGDLQSVVEHTAVPEDAARVITRQLVEGIAFMHDNDFVHRDLKLANILIVQPGPDWWVKIGDFGISKRARDASTELRTPIGTPGYTAPEVLGYMERSANPQSPEDEVKQDQAVYTTAVDMWSLGELVYRLITQKPVFPGALDMMYFSTGQKALNMKPLSGHGASFGCQDFIKRLLVLTASDRLNATSASQHHWLAETESAQQGRDQTIPQREISERALDSKSSARTRDLNLVAVDEVGTPSAQWTTVSLARYSVGEPRSHAIPRSYTVLDSLNRNSPVSKTRETFRTNEELTKSNEGLPQSYSASRKTEDAPVASGTTARGLNHVPQCWSINIHYGQKLFSVKIHSPTLAELQKSARDILFIEESWDLGFTCRAEFDLNDHLSADHSSLERTLWSDSDFESFLSSYAPGNGLLAYAWQGYLGQRPATNVPRPADHVLLRIDNSFETVELPMRTTLYSIIDLVPGLCLLYAEVMNHKETSVLVCMECDNDLNYLLDHLNTNLFTLHAETWSFRGSPTLSVPLNEGVSALAKGLRLRKGFNTFGKGLQLGKGVSTRANDPHLRSSQGEGRLDAIYYRDWLIHLRKDCRDIFRGWLVPIAVESRIPGTSWPRPLEVELSRNHWTLFAQQNDHGDSKWCEVSSARALKKYLCQEQALRILLVHVPAVLGTLEQSSKRYGMKLYGTPRHLSFFTQSATRISNGLAFNKAGQNPPRKPSRCLCEKLSYEDILRAVSESLDTLEPKRLLLRCDIRHQGRGFILQNDKDLGRVRQNPEDWDLVVVVQIKDTDGK